MDADDREDCHKNAAMEVRSLGYVEGLLRIAYPTICEIFYGELCIVD
jgi:hypothetical protein